MHIRRISVAVASGLVAAGAWYGYKGSATSESSKGQSQSLTTSAYSGANAAETSTVPSANTRQAVVVTADSIYTGSIEGDEPISKYTDNSGRKVLEMLTAEQATQKLRTNEESYFVGRGQGVVRYDVVQIPSNDPIEDDHSEKIVEVPHAVATAESGNPSSDWMFWGVYDGHRYGRLETNEPTSANIPTAGGQLPPNSGKPLLTMSPAN
jgi:pyruvate dehydrogenase phosphatase